MDQDSGTIAVRPVGPADSSAWHFMRCNLWPGYDSDHAQEISSFFAGTIEEPAAVLVAESAGGALVAFAELSIRQDVPGLEGVQVGYIEGLYVEPDMRWRGIARMLLQASRDWARGQKCTALASDRAGRVIADVLKPRCRPTERRECSKTDQHGNFRRFRGWRG